MAGERRLEGTPPTEANSALGIAFPLGQLRQLVAAMRPRQWAKNLLLYLAFFFTLGQHTSDGFVNELGLFGEATLGFLLFCLLSGATYIVNDVLDLEADRLHPTKQHRPLAAGRLSPTFALIGAAIMASVAVAFAFVLDAGFGVASVGYLAVILAYNLGLKNMVILDVMAVASGFVLRAAAGALVIGVPISPWLYVMTSLGALLISLGKRRHELATLGATGSSHRRVLEDYSTAFLDQLVAIVAPATLVAYTLYTFTAENLPADNTMMLTIPFVLYGIFRYLFLIHRRNLGGSPEEIFLTDRPMLINILLWLATASGILLYAR
ncbi:MAG: decaprenyl-phosphate phosphoribosyltransferase [Chloroflexi bacterium]|nr:decaprenyl-phosphate phosphoribosyltransferase [Chloroflexota bacterium]